MDPAIGRRRIPWNEIDFFRWPGLKLLEAENGVSRVELGVENHHRGGGGSPRHVNGGIVSYMFDALLGAAVESTWDEGVIGQVTITLNVQFVDAVEAESRIEGTARVLRRGGGLVFGEGQIFDERGRLGATCTGVYKLFRSKQEARPS
ncbi:hypothetical protein GBA65_16510 [Rubrobacter marinus]|uniref:Thioesterase domain-containing protein n=1 Tax=Rubrobacter marinus TaxID=2653852 RepID=A0A6G8Q060_9ACTN|nr:PaaI family thioesterase [Rubrobacter marinus]QIN79863.1 hypothetical protein GBA65_16510 [Rubrobacter marinus]